MVNPTVRVCGTVVTYHPDAEFPRRLALIEQQCDIVVIVDNSSSQQTSRMLVEIASDSHRRVRLIENGSNLGLACGLNQATEWAREQGFDFIIAFDQDTTPSLDLISRLLEGFQSASRHSAVALAGPMSWNLETEPSAERHVQYHEATNIVTSGMLISMRAYDRIGPFREEFMVYSVDTDYCLRARSRGFRVILVESACMAHRYGVPEQHYFLGRFAWASNYSAGRRYMITRSTSVLLREYAATEPVWAFRSIKNTFAKEMLKVILLEPDKIKKVRAMVRGIVDGLSRRDRRPGMAEL